MPLLTALASLVASDPFPAALADLERARANLATAKTRDANGTAQREARAKEVEAFPHLDDGTFDFEGGSYSNWSPARDAGKAEIAEAERALRAAESAYDAVEPRAEALRERIRAAREIFTGADRDPRIAKIQTHAQALRDLGVEVDDLAAAAVQKQIGEHLAAIAFDLNALRQQRRAEGMPEAHLFAVRRVGECPALVRLGGYSERMFLDGLREAVGALTLEALDGVIALLGTQPARLEHGAEDYERKQRASKWESTQRRAAIRYIERERKFPRGVQA